MKKITMLAGMNTLSLIRGSTFYLLVCTSMLAAGYFLSVWPLPDESVGTTACSTDCALSTYRFSYYQERIDFSSIVHEVMAEYRGVDLRYSVDCDVDQCQLAVHSRELDIRETLTERVGSRYQALVHNR